MGKIKILSGQDSGKEFLIPQIGLNIGRAKNVEVCLNDPAVSRCHARIFIDDNNYIIEDQNSNNGLFVNNQKVKKIILKNEDIISLGNSQLQFLQVASNISNYDEKLVVINDEKLLDPNKSIMIDLDSFDALKSGIHVLSAPDKIKDSLSNQKRYRQLQAMLKISNAVASIFKIDELINELLNVIFEETHATRGFIMLYDDNHELLPMAVKKLNADDENISISKTIIKTVVEQKKAILSSDLMNDDRFNSGVSIIANQIRSCMVVPLAYHEEILGVVHIDSDITANIFNEDDLGLLVAISNQAAACIKNNYLLKKITEEQNKRSKLSQYFPPAQVEMLMNNRLNISLGGKTEKVTIIFCDIRSFTKISESMNATEVMSFLNDFFSVMTEIIFNYDGMVDNFMGDCIMAVFGGPFYHENDPERALLAAIDMQLAQRKLNDRFLSEGRQTFDIGIGIHSGEVSRGNIGSPQLKKYTVIGSTVNVTSRLCSQAKAGVILISEETASNLPSNIKLEKMDPVYVKNVTQPLISYKVIY